jgi:phosphatidylglycerol---prolipoprotein diacylglyceryl transferase
MLGWEVIPRIPLGNLSVSPHGVGIALGYFLGATLMARRARRTGFDEDHAWNAAVVGILGAIVGARVAYIIGHNNQFSEPVEYLQIYKGGISLMGGLIGGFFAAWLYCRSKKLDFLRLADLGAAGLAIGTAVGRIGDLVIGDHLGRTTDGFWGWEYKGGELISAPPCDPAVYPSPDGCIQPGMVVHQTALYDSLWALVIFFVLLRLERKPRPKGFLVLTWAAMYSVGRILTDFTRVDKTWFGTGLTGSQLTAIAVLALSLILLTVRRKAPAVATVSPPKGAVSEPEIPAAGGEAAAAVAPSETEPQAQAAEAGGTGEPVPAPAEPETLGTEVAAPGAGDAPVEEPVVPVEPVDSQAPEATAPGEPVVPVEDEALPAQAETVSTDEPDKPVEEAPDVLATVQEDAPEPEMPAGREGPVEAVEEPGPEAVEAADAAEAVVVEAALPLDAPVGEADPAEVAALVETEEAQAEPALESLLPSDIEQLQAEQAETSNDHTEPADPEAELPPVTPAEPTVLIPGSEVNVQNVTAEGSDEVEPDEPEPPPVGKPEQSQEP